MRDRAAGGLRLGAQAAAPRWRSRRAPQVTRPTATAAPTRGASRFKITGPTRLSSSRDSSWCCTGTGCTGSGADWTGPSWAPYGRGQRPLCAAHFACLGHLAGAGDLRSSGRCRRGRTSAAVRGTAVRGTAVRGTAVRGTAGRGRGYPAGGELLREVVREPVDQPRTHLGDHPPAELRGTAGYIQRGVQSDQGGAGPLEPFSGRRAARTVAEAVPEPRISLPDASTRTGTVRLVPVLEGGRPLVGQRNRSHLDLQPAATSSPSTVSTWAPGMQGATFSTSSRTSQACSGGTGTVNE